MIKDTFRPVDILYLENINGFANVRKQMLQKDGGVEVAGKNSHRYTWLRVADFYIICVVALLDRSQKTVNGQMEKYVVDHLDTQLHDLMYHRIDLLPPLPPKSICRYIKQLATFGKFISLPPFVLSVEFISKKSLPSGTELIVSPVRLFISAICRTNNPLGGRM